VRSDDTPAAITTFGRLGHDLARPECVLATASGRLFVSDRRGGVTCIEPDGRQHRQGTSALVPNGIALQRDGSFLVADLGDQGGVWRIDTQGTVQPWLMEFEGRRLPRVNYVTTDEHGRTWVCVSATRTGDAYPLDDATGFILQHDRHGVRLVADGLRYTNEIRLHPDGASVYVNETFGRRLSRLRVAADGRLTQRATVAEFGPGDFPDGLALDAEGGVWVVCVGSNRVYRVLPDGRKQLLVDDADPQCVERLEQAFSTGALTRPMLGGARGRALHNITSLAFAGPDLRSAHLGSLSGDSLVTFHSPVAGLRPAHWHWA